MTNGLGAGFFGVTVLAVIAGLAGLAVLLAGASYAFVLRRNRVPRPLQYMAVGVLVAVVAIAGFAVAVLYDEAMMLAGLFLLLVFIPLLAGGVVLARTTGVSRLNVAVATPLAWGLPFFVGVAIVFGGMELLTGALELTSGEAGRLGLPWIAATIGSLAIVVGTIGLSGRVARVVTFERDRRNTA